MSECGVNESGVIPTVNVQRSEEICREFAPTFQERRRAKKEEA